MRFKVWEMQADEQIPGNILAIVDYNLVTISPQNTVTFVIVEESYKQCELQRVNCCRFLTYHLRHPKTKPDKLMTSWSSPIKHINVQSCLLIHFQYKPISLQYSWLSVEQPIRIDWVVYKHHWEFPINKKIIPKLTALYEMGLSRSFL